LEELGKLWQNESVNHSCSIQWTYLVSAMRCDILITSGTTWFICPSHLKLTNIMRSCSVAHSKTLQLAFLALHMSRAFCKAQSLSFSSLEHILSQVILQTIRSLIRLSFSSVNSQVYAFVCKSVTHWSMILPACWLRVLYMGLFQVTFLHGMQ